MKEVSYVVVFPTVFSKNKIPQLISNIKKILKIRNQEFKSIKRDGEDLRAGRWWWENDETKECGLHMPEEV